MLTRDLLNRIVDALLPEMGDVGNRRALVESALYGCAVLQKIQWEGAARPFTIRLVRLLDQFGEVEPGRAAIVALLERVRQEVGADRQTEIDDLLAQLRASPTTPASLENLRPVSIASQETMRPRSDSFAEGELYVFISYARADRDVAEKVEEFLTAAGIRVFRDTSDVRVGEDWIVRIDRALRECQRMVLLLSRSSMPYRKEVHLEWVAFDREQKPIYPLYLEDCELLYRLRVYNYIDARSHLQSALERLLKDLRRDFTPPPPITGAEKINIVEGAATEAGTLPDSMQALLNAVRDPEYTVVLSLDKAHGIKDHRPGNLTEFRLGRIAEWSLPRYYLDKRFVNLTLLLDKGEHESQRWHRADEFRFDDLRDVLEKTREYPVVALLGAPGSGKSTLLRRLQLDHSIDRLRDDGDQGSFFVQLNGYRARANGELPEPREWLNACWAALYPQLPSLEKLLQRGRALLLLDALNEMPHKNTADYHHLVGLWRALAQDASREGNRVIFSCRSLDYSASLSSPDLRVPQVEVQPMSSDKVREFLKLYVPAHEERVWNELNGSRQFGLYQTPYFLKLLCEQVEATGDMPKGRAALFTGFVLQGLRCEVVKENQLFKAGVLLTERDHLKLSIGHGRLGPFDLPERGLLINRLSDLAFTMQTTGVKGEGAQIRIAYDDACKLIANEHAEQIIQAGLALIVLDEDITQEEIVFFHQLLQEYFAARRLAREPKPGLVHVEWAVESVRPTLEETLAGLADSDPLPPSPRTGWEETTLTAAPMAKDPEAFIRDLIPHNLPLAARCAASPELSVSDNLKREIQNALIVRTQDKRADLRARITGGEALGTIGDPRFERRTAPHGDYLLPPLVEIPAGTYRMGDDEGSYDDEKPGHTVELASFRIGRFPVTNAEYGLFINGGGYDNERLWDTEESLAWLRGEATTEGIKQQAREYRKIVQGWTEDYIRSFVTQGRWTTRYADDWITWRNWTDEHFERQLDEWYPSGKLYRQPEFWDDTRFNNPSQPVVGVTWFEARAYCNWLTANARSDATLRDYLSRLPTEAEFEAAARGSRGRLFPYGARFDATRSNTFESHIRRTTPVGIFDNATPEGTFDLSGNAYTWTLSIYDQERFPYPYRSDDGREDIHRMGVSRVLRGGSWRYLHDFARAVYRNNSHPAYRNFLIGFRVVCSGVRPPSL